MSIPHSSKVSSRYLIACIAVLAIVFVISSRSSGDLASAQRLPDTLHVLQSGEISRAPFLRSEFTNRHFRVDSEGARVAYRTPSEAVHVAPTVDDEYLCLYVEDLTKGEFWGTCGPRQQLQAGAITVESIEESSRQVVGVVGNDVKAVSFLDSRVAVDNNVFNVDMPLVERGLTLELQDGRSVPVALSPSQ